MGNDETATSQTPESEAGWKTKMAAEQDKIRTSIEARQTRIADAAAKLSEELRGRVNVAVGAEHTFNGSQGPINTSEFQAQQNETTNRLSWASDLQNAPDRIFGVTPIAQDAFNTILGERTALGHDEQEMKRLNGWENYLNSQDEVDKRVTELEVAIQSLNKDIQERKLAGVESPLLEREMANNQRELDYYKSTLPQELVNGTPDNPNDDYTRELIEAARNKQSAGKNGQSGNEPRQDDEDNEAERYRELVANDGGTPVAAGAGEEREDETPLGGWRPFWERDNYSEEKSEHNPPSAIPALEPDIDNNGDQDEESDNQSGLQPGAYWPERRGEDNEDDRREEPRPETHRPWWGSNDQDEDRLEPETPSQPTPERRWVTEDFEIQEAQEAMDRAADRYIRAKARSRKLFGTYVLGLVRRLTGGESRDQEMAGAREAYETQRNRYIGLEAARAANAALPEIRNSEMYAYREKLVEEAAALTITEINNFTTRELALNERGRVYQVLSRIYRQPGLRAAVGIGLGIAIPASLATGMWPVALGAIGAKYALSVVGTEGLIHKIQDTASSLMGPTRKLGMTEDRISRLYDQSLIRRFASFNEDRIRKHLTKASETETRLIAEYQRRLREHLQQQVHEGGLTGDTNEKTAQVLTDMLQAENSNAAKDRELKAARIMDAFRRSLAMAIGAFFIPGTGHAFPQPPHTGETIEFTGHQDLWVDGQPASSAWGYAQAAIANNEFGISNFDPNNPDHLRMFREAWAKDPAKYSTMATKIVDFIHASGQPTDFLSADSIAQDHPIKLLTPIKDFIARIR